MLIDDLGKQIFQIKFIVQITITNNFFKFEIKKNVIFAEYMHKIDY